MTTTQYVHHSDIADGTRKVLLDLSNAFNHAERVTDELSAFFSNASHFYPNMTVGDQKFNIGLSFDYKDGIGRVELSATGEKTTQGLNIVIAGQNAQILLWPSDTNKPPVVSHVKMETGSRGAEILTHIMLMSAEHQACFGAYIFHAHQGLADIAAKAGRGTNLEIKPITVAPR